ncbi:MAG: ATP-binding protein [Bacteroidota bacterium]
MRRNKVYFYATLAAIGLILMNQVFIQYWLFQKQQDASLINKAGRQRMLSQRILAEAYALQVKDSKRLQNIRAYYTEWDSAHQYLLEAQKEQFWTWTEKEVFQQLTALTQFFKEAEAYILELEKGNSPPILALRENQDTFLEYMDEAVINLQIASDRKLNFVIIIEIVFAMMSLSLIYYEITFVFKRVDNELRAKNRELTSSNRMLEDYAYLAAHDLRSPAQNIINFSKVLQKKFKEGEHWDEKEKEYLGFIQQSAERLKETTNDLLEFSRINSENLLIRSQEIEQILSNVMVDLTEEIEKSNAKISISSMPAEIQGDSSLLRLLFQNLISNAIKFVPVGRQAEIHISYESKENQHIFIVKDNGIGIKEEDQANIFKLFKRLNNQEDFEGTGIGLSLCEKIVEKHYGKIYVESQENKGSKFFIEIPKKLV